MNSPDVLLPGFADASPQSQSCFRAVLDAMAHPGRIVAVTGPTPPAPLHAATGAVLLTLLDADTPTWLDGACAPAESWLAFHCGALLVAPAQASFAVACDMPALATLNAGTDAAPETAATLVLQVAALGAGTNYGLSGPGLAAPGALRVRGLPADFVTQWRANHAQFPRGVDIILCAPDRIAALPRSVEIT